MPTVFGTKNNAKSAWALVLPATHVEKQETQTSYRKDGTSTILSSGKVLVPARPKRLRLCLTCIYGQKTIIAVSAHVSSSQILLATTTAAWYLVQIRYPYQEACN